MLFLHYEVIVTYWTADRCIICNEPPKDHISQISASSLENIQNFSHRWSEIGKNIDVFKRVSSLTFPATVHRYHRKYYQSLCHHVHLSKAQKKHETNLQCSMSRKKRSNSAEESLSAKSRKLFDQELCVFCQHSDRSDIHNVRTEDMGRKPFSIKVSSKSDDIRARFAFIHDVKDTFA